MGFNIPDSSNISNSGMSNSLNLNQSANSNSTVVSNFLENERPEHNSSFQPAESLIDGKSNFGQKSIGIQENVNDNIVNDLVDISGTGKSRGISGNVIKNPFARDGPSSSKINKFDEDQQNLLDF